MARDLTGFIAGLPKVELHVHHIGSATPQAVARLAERHAGSTGVPADPVLLADYFTFTDFAHFIDVYLSVVDLVRDAEDVATLTYDIGAGLAAQSVRYAELTLRIARRWRTPAAGSPATTASSCAGASTSRASPRRPART